MRKIWIVTLFPEYFDPLINCGVVGKALRGERGAKDQAGQLEQIVQIERLQLRDFSKSAYKSVDDYPYGGGMGMVLRADVLRDALLEGICRSVGIPETKEAFKEQFHVFCPSPRGKVWNRDYAWDMSLRLRAHSAHACKNKDWVFICGRYEGIDERFLTQYVDEEMSLGDFILSGGEPAVLAILDSILRLVPGTLGQAQGALEESFEEGLLEAGLYTRPAEFEGLGVPEIYLSGHHAKMDLHKKQESWATTQKFRPDLYALYGQGERK